jgi:hypothetical protein
MFLRMLVANLRSANIRSREINRPAAVALTTAGPLSEVVELTEKRISRQSFLMDFWISSTDLRRAFSSFIISSSRASCAFGAWFVQLSPCSF